MWPYGNAIAPIKDMELNFFEKLLMILGFIG